MNKFTRSLTAIALAAGFSLAAIVPASADQADATRNQIIGGLALIAGIATAVNVSNKNAEAQREQSYDDYSYRTNDNGRTYRNTGNASNNGYSSNQDYQQNGGQRRWAQRGWQR